MLITIETIKNAKNYSEEQVAEWNDNVDDITSIVVEEE